MSIGIPGIGIPGERTIERPRDIGRDGGSSDRHPRSPPLLVDMGPQTLCTVY